MKLILMTLFLTANVFAQSTLKDCSMAGEQFGSQKSTPSSIPSECHSLIKQTKSTYNFSRSEDQLVYAIGNKNLLQTKTYKINAQNTLTVIKQHITSGENSKLTNILAVKVNNFDQKTYVLNQDNDNFSLYSYFYQSGGNNVPARKLVTPEIINATNFKIDNTNEETYILSAIDGWIKVFNRDADPDGPRPQNSVQLKRSFKGIDSQLNAPIDLSISNDELFVLDSDQILVFNKNDTNNTKPKRVIAGDRTQINQGKYISVQGNFIIVTNHNEQIIKFNKNDSGNISPR